MLTAAVQRRRTAHDGRHVRLNIYRMWRWWSSSMACDSACDQGCDQLRHGGWPVPMWVVSGGS